MDVAAHSFGTMEELTDYPKFRAAYLEANGGEARLKKVLSIRNSGVMISGEAEVPFFTIKRRPDKSLMTLKMRDYDLTFGVDGDVVWQRVKVDGQAPQYELKTGAEGRALGEMGEFFDSTMRVLLLNKGKIEHLSPSQWSGADAVKIEFSPDESNIRVSAYVDIRTMHQLARIEEFSDGRTRKILYDDYRNVAGMMEPFQVETYINDVLQSRIVIDKCEANVGAILSLFEYPESQKSAPKGDNSESEHK
ncbi:hypothetical protein ACWPKO_02410 [Coraliomargarita sp. W4R53]